MMKKIFQHLFLIVPVFMSGCEEKKSVSQMSDEERLVYAQELAQRFIITDGHIDLPDVLLTKGFQVGVTSTDTILHTGKGEFDYERAKKGGLNAPFMSIYIPIGHQALPDMGKALADSLIDIVMEITQKLPDKFILARSPHEIEKAVAEGKIALPMGMENGAPIGNDLANLKYFYDRGIRYITLAHNKDNQICDASKDTTHTWKGLSPFGEQVVEEMNKLGIIVDISHVDDSTFYDVMKLSKAPAIASHSSCRHLAPSVMRDMTDDMIRVLGEHDGVIMINYYTSFLDPDPSTVTVETVVNHIDHVVKIAGIDHVGIGSDFDGVDGELPTGLEDVSSYPVLIDALLKRGYSEEDIEKICTKNIFRVWNKVEEISKGK